MSSISEMFTMDIKTEICSNRFLLLDFTLNDKYRNYILNRTKDLEIEYEKRLKEMR